LLLAAIALVATGAVLHYARVLISTGTAYKAKVLCSDVFVSRRDPQSVLDSDLAADDLAMLRMIDAQVQPATRSTSSDLMGLVRRTATYRPGLGCALNYSGYEHDTPHPDVQALQGRHRPHHPWPEWRNPGSHAKHVDRARLESVLDWAFSEPDPAHRRRTRAVVIVHEGRIVGERYAPGFDVNTPLIGWSLTKSVTHALVGILVKQGKLSITDPVRAPEWRQPDDNRARISLDHLLRMTSGLDFDEDYNDPLADISHMLLHEPDMAAYAANKPLEAEPGSRWVYSSGTTNILNRSIRQAVGDAGYLTFPRRALFDPLEMVSAILEPDASGTFVGSAFMYATARDWARFGQLYLQDGVWNGSRILPEGWVRHAITPTPHSVNSAYGAHFWVKIPGEFATGGNADKIPADAFHAVGHEGQFITIIPSHKLVVVRLGLSRYTSSWQHDTFIAKILEAFDF